MTVLFILFMFNVALPCMFWFVFIGFLQMLDTKSYTVLGLERTEPVPEIETVRFGEYR